MDACHSGPHVAEIAQGLGAAIISLALDFTGYESSLGALEQQSGVAEKIYFMTGILPCIGSVICLVSMHFLYTLDDAPLSAEKKEE